MTPLPGTPVKVNWLVVRRTRKLSCGATAGRGWRVHKQSYAKGDKTTSVEICQLCFARAHDYAEDTWPEHGNYPHVSTDL